MPMRAAMLACLGIGIATTLAVHGQTAPARQPFTVVEASISEMRRAMEQRRTTSRDSSSSTIGAASPGRGPSFVMRVYPPGTSLKTGAISLNRR